MTTTVMQGVQEPRIYSIPDYVSTAGEEAVELAAMAGLELDEWQQFIIVNALGERADGKWAASAVGVVVPRQNGKGGLIEARQLAGLYLLGEPLQIYSAHLFDTSLEAFRRLANLVEGSDELSRRVKRISRAHGEEGIELYGPKGRRVTGGQRIRFRTRTKGGGRGFSGECVYFDESMIFPEVSHAAILPILSAQPNPQAWYLGSAVDQTIHEDGIVFAGIRERGLTGEDERLAYFEHSADFDTPEDVDDEAASDEEMWAQANPALGIRITVEAIRDELKSLGARSFAVERLGVGDWPDTNDDGEVISLEEWDALLDPKSKIESVPCFAYDVTPDRTWATISAAGQRGDDLFHVETVDRRKGVRWIVDRLVELNDKHSPAAIVCDGASAAASLVDELADRGIEVKVATAKDMANACGQFFDAVIDDPMLRHLGTPELRAAIRGAKQRTLGDAWAWSRKSSSVDITPLVAATLALWAAAAATPSPWATSW